MDIELVTKEDLEIFHKQLLRDITAVILSQGMGEGFQVLEGYKTKDVRKMLKCSVNKLVSLRVARKIRWKKIGGTVYYNQKDVNRLLEEGF